MQLQQEARSKVLKAFKAALRYMDEESLQSHVAMYLQLQPSTEEEDVEAQCSGLQAPQALSCPRKPRTRRCPRPASAASLGLAREVALNRPVSAPAERSGQHCSPALAIYTYCMQLYIYLYRSYLCQPAPRPKQIAKRSVLRPLLMAYTACGEAHPAGQQVIAAHL